MFHDIHSDSLVQINSTHNFVLQSKPNVCGGGVRYRSIPCWFHFRDYALGLWHMGTLLNSFCWTHLNPKFQDAPCWPSRNDNPWFCRDKCELLLPNASFYTHRMLDDTQYLHQPSLRMGNYFLSVVGNHDKLGPQMVSHDLTKTAFCNPVSSEIKTYFKSWGTP